MFAGAMLFRGVLLILCLAAQTLLGQTRVVRDSTEASSISQELNAKALEAEAQGRQAEAKKFYHASISADPEQQWQAKANLANLLMRNSTSGEHERNIESLLLSSMSINSGHGGLLYTYGVFLRSRGRIKEAVVTFEKAIVDRSEMGGIK